MWKTLRDQASDIHYTNSACTSYTKLHIQLSPYDTARPDSTYLTRHVS